MSNFSNAITPAYFESIGPVSFVAGNSTLAKVLVEPKVGAAAAGTLPAFYGGCTIIDLTASSTDAASKDVYIYLGRIFTTQETTATGAMTTTTSTIPRTNGSFITDGWLVGDLVMTFAPVGTAPNASMDGVLGVVTTVAALTLTVNGTPFAALTLAAGTRIVKVSPLFRAPVAASSGTNGTAPNVLFQGNALDSTATPLERKLGTTDMLIGAMQAAVAALPAYVSFTGQVARY